MKLTQRIVQWFSVIALAATSSAALAAPLPQDPINLDQLLQQLEQGKFSQSESNKQREQRFREKEQEQKAMLEDAIAQRNQLEQRAEQLETNFEQNEVDLGNLSDTLTQRMGSLKELFGVLQQVANDASGKFDNSVISAQYPGRSDALEELAENMSSSSKLASIEDIESVWFALQKEMTESGKVAEFTTEVTAANGDKAEQEVVRVGAFNLVSNGKYLERMSSTGSVAELVRQPSGRYLDTAENIQQTDSGIVTFGVDPTGGSILGLLVQAPSLGERIDQGGTVGYIILALGAIGLLVALERFVSLMLLGNKRWS